MRFFSDLKVFSWQPPTTMYGPLAVKKIVKTLITHNEGLSQLFFALSFDLRALTMSMLLSSSRGKVRYKARLRALKGTHVSPLRVQDE